MTSSGSTASAERDALGVVTGPSLEQLLAVCGLAAELGVDDGTHGVVVLHDAEVGRSTGDASCEPAYTACEFEVLTECGPGTEAIESGRVVLVTDLLTETRWPAWRQMAERLRWRSVLAAPVGWPGGSGAVVVYFTDPGAGAHPGEGR